MKWLISALPFFFACEGARPGHHKRVLVVDVQGMCWKASAWQRSANGRVSLLGKKGVVVFDRPPYLFALEEKTSWTEAARHLAVRQQDCLEVE